MKKSKKYSILVVEDEFLNAEFVEQTILDLGHSVVANVKSASEALEIAKNTKIDFVFMDINLIGVIDGLQCAVLLNRDKNIPIIYMTAFTETNMLAEAMETNLYGYIIKPFTQYSIDSALLVAIKKLLDMESIDSVNNTLIYDVSLGDGYIYFLENRQLFFNDIPIIFTKTLTKLLHILVLNINEPISYQLLVDFVWKDKNISISTIRDTILRLRQKVPSLDIENISGVGYSLKNR